MRAMHPMMFRLAFAAAFACLSVAAHAAETSGEPQPGTRSGPFVVSTHSITQLTNDGYEIRGNLGSALVLQKGASIFSCQIPPDPENLSFKPYFICSELQEEFPKTMSTPQKLPIPSPRGG